MSEDRQLYLWKVFIGITNGVPYSNRLWVLGIETKPYNVY